MAGDSLRKKIIGLPTMIVFLAILCTQSVVAQVLNVHVYVWTDKPQYKPGEKGALKISVLNECDEPIEIYNITIIYPWFAYDAEQGKWVGNETIKLEPAEKMLGSKGGKYYKSVEFTIPSDGRVGYSPPKKVEIKIETSKGTLEYPQVPHVYLQIASASLPMSIVDLDTWMTSLTVAVVICTIILAVVVFLSTRRARVPRMAAPPVSKAKAE